jgi:hypothetical protein
MKKVNRKLQTQNPVWVLGHGHIFCNDAAAIDGVSA